MAWSGSWPLAAGTPIQPGLFLELSTAHKERAALGGGSGATPGAAWGNPGDDIQHHSFYNDIQAFCEIGCVSFVRTDLTYDRGGAPANPNDWRYTLATFRAAAGLDAAGFTRRYWNQFAGMAATAYTDAGRAFANGDKALNLADGLVYQRAAGAWVRLGGCWGNIRPDTYTTHGRMQQGDFIDRVAYNELYQALRALVWTQDGGNLDLSANRYADNSAGTDYSWAAAKTRTENDWDGGGHTNFVDDGPCQWTTGQQGTEFGTGLTVWVSEMHGVRGRVQTVGSPPHFCNRAFDFYAYATKPPAANGAAGTRYVYDDNGTGLVEDDWNLIGTTGPTNSAATQSSPYIGSNTVHPAWAAGPTVDGQGTVRGWVVAGEAAYGGVARPNYAKAVVVRWDVAGGFTKP